MESRVGSSLRCSPAVRDDRDRSAVCLLVYSMMLSSSLALISSFGASTTTKPLSSSLCCSGSGVSGSSLVRLVRSDRRDIHPDSMMRKMFTSDVSMQECRPRFVLPWLPYPIEETPMALGHGADAQGKKGKGNLLCELPGRLGSAFPSIHHLPELLWRLACLVRPSRIFSQLSPSPLAAFPMRWLFPMCTAGHACGKGWMGVWGRDSGWVRQKVRSRRAR